MKPIKLQLIEFGSYRNETIDFQSLVAQPIFLITGKTGSGKSTLFNAISFALYNKISTTTKNSHFRSKYAEDKVQTKVVFEFEIKGDIYKIERTLPYLKTGNKRETPGKVYLFKKEQEDFILVESKDVSKKIENLIGLSYEEFNQIIVLPQGKFKELLMSDANKKGQILRSLFNTTFYKMFTDKLNIFSKEKANELKEKEIEFLENLKHFSFSEKLNDYNFVTDEIFDNIDEQKNSSEIILKEINEQLEKKLADYEQVEKNYKKLEKINDNFSSLDSNIELKKNLDRDKGTIENLTREIEKLEIVKANEFIISSYNKNNIKLSKENKNLEDYKNKRDELVILIEQKEADLEQLEKNREQIEEIKRYLLDNNYFYKNIDDYNKAFIEEKNYSEKLVQLEKIAYDKKETEEKLITLTNTRENLMEEQESLTKTLLNLTEEISILKEQNMLLSQFNAKKTKLSDDEKLLEQIEGNLKKANEQLLVAKDSYSQLEKNIKENYLSNLAKTLHIGDNCPLCQAKIKHLPSFEKSEITDKEVENARLKVENKTIAISKLEQQKNSLLVGIDELKEQLSKDQQNINFSVEQQLEKATTDKNNKEKELEDTNSKLNDIKEQILIYEESIASFTEKLVEKKELEESLTKVTVKVQEITKKLQGETLEQFKQNYIDKEKEIEQFEQQIIEAKKNIEQLEKNKVDCNLTLTTTENEIANLKQNLLEIEEELNKQKIYNYYNNIEEITLSLNELSHLENYQQQVEKYNKEYIKITDEIIKLEDGLKGLERPNLLLEQEKKINFASEIDEIKEQRVKIELNLENDKKLLDKLKILFKTYSSLAKQYSEIAKLTEMIVKGGDSKISLERYVQGYYLDLILSAASDRLMKMTNSRYSLERTDEKQGNSNAGLDIKVFDNHQNGTRNIATLSGGELFLASLALALGLAEVIQSSNGTISLETIFIDEGFGSLDSETLDMAITTLIDLQSYGRNIGIISHVSELKERIPVKLEIINSDKGAKTKITGI